MFNFLKEVKESVNEFDKLTSDNCFMSNPFNKVINKTFVWTEKTSLFENLFKKV